MNRGLLTVLGLSLALASNPAQAHDIKIASATGLLANCSLKSPEQTEIEFHTGFCLGFIKAVMNTRGKHGETFCLTEETENGDLIEAVLDLLYRLPPDMKDAPSDMVIQVALEQHFPCQ